MKALVKRTAVTALAGVMAAGMLTGCGEKNLDGTKTVVTVNGTEVPLGVVSLAARRQQAQTEAMYASFFGSDVGIWDTEMTDGSEKTYGEQAVEDVMKQVELMCIMKEKAADYGVEVTEEDQKAIAEAAAAFMAANSEETIRALAVTEDQVKTYLELQTYYTRMQDPIVADVDTEVSDEEAQQTSFTYVSISNVVEEETEETEDTADEEATTDEAADAEDTTDGEDAAADEEADAENTADAEDTTDGEDATTDEEADAEDTADAEDAAADEEANAEETTDGEDADTEDTADSTDSAADPKEKAQEVLDKVMADPDGDMDALAKEVDETYSALSGHFSTNESPEEESEEEEADYSGTSYPDKVLAALRELKDGEVCENVIETEDSYYIVRLDKVFDEEATESEKDSIVEERKSDLYTETTDGWLEEAEIKVQDKVLDTLTITENHSFKIQTPTAAPEEEDAGTEAEEGSEDAETGDDAADAETETADAATETEDDAEDADAETGDDAADTEEDADAAAQTDTEADADTAQDTAADEDESDTEASSNTDPSDSEPDEEAEAETSAK